MLYVLMGKSATGKDTIFRKLLGISGLRLKKIVPYTTRPMRQGEIDGQEYHFVDEDTMKQLDEDGRIAEHRCYRTVHGDWHYFTADDGTDIKNSCERFITIGTLEAYIRLRDYYGAEYVTPLYVYVNDFERLIYGSRASCGGVQPSRPGSSGGFCPRPARRQGPPR